jgi:DnaK suppressor protein
MATNTIEVKAQLQQQLDETLAELARLEEKLAGNRGEYGLGKGDPGIYEWEMCLALKQSTEANARSLLEALHKADEGDYGICEKCGRPIDPARLAILPSTRRCVQCASKR